MSFTHTRQVETKYTLDQIKSFTTDLFNTRTGKYTLSKRKHYDLCMQLLSNYIRANRWELLGSFAGYKTITNGYGEFKSIEGENSFTAHEIFHKIEELI